MLQSIKNKLQTYLNLILPKPINYDVEFSGRIKNRHKLFWNVPNAERVRNKIMSAGDPDRKMEKCKELAKETQQ
jgi:hypothetical protein